MFTVDSVLERYFPKSPYKKVLAPVLRQLLHEQEFQAFADRYPHLSGWDFIEGVLDHLDVGYRVADREKERIPQSGAVVIIANHPIGSIDGLALLKLVSEVRRDVKVVANALLSELEPLQPLLFPVNNMIGQTHRGQFQAITNHLQQGKAVIVFPAGEVSRLRPQGVRDTRWRSGFLRMARQAQAPVLPVRVNARNSALFYSTSMLYKPLATTLLVKEMFRHRNTQLDFHVGELVPFSQLESIAALPLRTQIKLFKKHLYRVGTQRRLPLKTESAIAGPEDRQALLKVLSKCPRLGETSDGMQIYLYDVTPDCPLLREIGRLRELAFRAVGEGTGQRRDTDRYDPHYQHIVLWDPEALEIAGAYRFGDPRKVGAASLYCATLFEFGPGMAPILDNGLELGRSFVHPSYWGKRALDYLWQGIGAFIRANPRYRYLFGAVSLSATLPAPARERLVQFYHHYFGQDSLGTRHYHPYRPQPLGSCDFFDGNDYKNDFVRLKSALARMDCSVPTLYKQYAELCEPGGVRFLDFGVDPDFANCIDGLVVVDLAALKPAKRARYIGGAE